MNYQQEMEQHIQALAGTRPSLVLHSCCAVCLSSVLPRLEPHFGVTVLCANPNIAPVDEYVKRLKEQERLLALTGSGARFAEIPYDHDAFLSAVRGLEDAPEGGARCDVCFSLRLRQAARYAAEHGIGLIASTLTVSPHKNAEAVNRAGAAAAEAFGVAWLPSDFKKKDGYLRSVRLARELGLYRQRYCGCEFARRDEEPGL